MGSLVQSRCGEGGALQADIAGVCGEDPQCSGHTGFAPTHGCVLSPSTLLRLPAVLYGACPVWRAVPVFGYSTKLQTWLGLCFVPSPAGAAQTARSLTGALSLGAVRLPPPRSQPQLQRAPVGCVRLVSILGSWPLAATLRQMSTNQNLRKSLVRNWRPVCSMVGDAVPGAEFAPFPSPLPPASAGGWAGPTLASSSLELLSPFALRTAVSVFRPVNFPSLSSYPIV